MSFTLEYDERFPVAYVTLGEWKPEQTSARQEIVDISGLTFTPKELIFDIAEDGTILGVELL